MNKFLLVLLSILGGIEVVFNIILPIVIAIFWIKMVGLDYWTSYLFIFLCLLATMFRAIKVGWIKK